MSLGNCVRNLLWLTRLGQSRIKKVVGFVRKHVMLTDGYLAAQKAYEQQKIGSDALIRSARSLKDLESARETGIHSGDEKLKKLSLRLWIERVEGLLPDLNSFEVAAVVLFSLPLGTPAERMVVDRLAEVAESVEDLEWVLWLSALRRHHNAVALAERKIKIIKLLGD